MPESRPKTNKKVFNKKRISQCSPYLPPQLLPLVLFVCLTFLRFYQQKISNNILNKMSKVSRKQEKHSIHLLNILTANEFPTYSVNFWFSANFLIRKRKKMSFLDWFVLVVKLFCRVQNDPITLVLRNWERSSGFQKYAYKLFYFP